MKNWNKVPILTKNGQGFDDCACCVTVTRTDTPAHDPVATIAALDQC